ncbi:MAG: molybdopterin biosynthesis protein [Opitutae bacterium]
MSTRYTLSAAWDWIDARATPLPIEDALFEDIASADAVDRVLAEAVINPHDLPDSDRAIIAGYAVRAYHTVGAGSYSPLSLPLALAINAGDVPPPDTDAVLGFDMAESAESAESTESISGRVLALAPVAVGEGIERRGRVLKAGAIAIGVSHRPLRPQDIGALAQLGVERVLVVARPRVRLEVAETLNPMLRALIARDGGMVGEPPDLIARLGWPDEPTPERFMDGVAMRPGDGAGLGMVGGIPLIVLPTEPLSCLFAYDMLAGRLVRLLSGRTPALPYTTTRARLSRKIVSGIGFVEMIRVRLVRGQAEPLGSADTGGLISAVHADGFVMVPAECEGFAPGAEVTVHLYGLLV